MHLVNGLVAINPGVNAAWVNLLCRRQEPEFTRPVLPLPVLAHDGLETQRRLGDDIRGQCRIAHDLVSLSGLFCHRP